LKYQNRISGPLLDRIDIQVGISGVSIGEIESMETGESSAAVRERVMMAREIQLERYKTIPGVVSNADIPGRLIRDVCKMTVSAALEMRRRMELLNLSARAYTRVLKVARTIADLAGHDMVDMEDVMEAVSYRKLDGGGQGFWA
jgi:magnesium chelatase family protein